MLDNLHPGAVILPHDWSAPEVGILWTDEPVITQADASNTIDALPTIIDEAHARGYCFGTLNAAGDIVGADPEPDPEPGPGPDPDAAADLPGVVRDRAWHLRNADAGGSADVEFQYGRSDDVPVVGDWNGDGPIARGSSGAAPGTCATSCPAARPTCASATAPPTTPRWSGAHAGCGS